MASKKPVNESDKQLSGYTRRAQHIEQRHAHVALTATLRCLPPWLTTSSMFLEMTFARSCLIHKGDAACISSMLKFVLVSPSHSPAVRIINRTCVRQNTRLKHTYAQTNDQNVVDLQKRQRTDLPALACASSSVKLMTTEDFHMVSEHIAWMSCGTDRT